MVSGDRAFPGAGCDDEPSREDDDPDYEYFHCGAVYFQCDQWAGIADQIMLKAGIFKFILANRPFAVTMADVYGYDNMANLGTCIFIIILVYFIFNHPKYHSLRQTEIQPYRSITCGRRFWWACWLLSSRQASVWSTPWGERWFSQTLRRRKWPIAGTVNITDTAQILQTFTADGDYLTDIRIRVGMHNRIKRFDNRGDGERQCDSGGDLPGTGGYAFHGEGRIHVSDCEGEDTRRARKRL